MEKTVRDRAESETMGGVYSSKSGKYFGKGKPKLKKKIAKQQAEEKTVKKNLSLMSILLFPIAIAINFVGGQIVALLRLPVFLDCIGTVLVGALTGPIGGLIVGVMTNLILGITAPTFIPYAVVSAAIGIVSGICAKRGMFKTVKMTLLTGVFVWIVTQLTAIPITTLVFGGVTGSGTSFITGFLVGAGQGLFQAVFTTSILTETIDKFITVLIAYFLIKSIPARTLSKFPLGEKYLEN